MRFHPHRNNTLMLILLALSAYSLLILVGGFLYSGSFIPYTQGASSREALNIWIHWSVIVVVPAVTLVLWILRLAIREKQ